MASLLWCDPSTHVSMGAAGQCIWFEGAADMTGVVHLRAQVGTNFEQDGSSNDIVPLAVRFEPPAVEGRPPELLSVR